MNLDRYKNIYILGTALLFVGSIIFINMLHEVIIINI